MRQGIESIPSPKYQRRALPSLLPLSFLYVLHHFTAVPAPLAAAAVESAAAEPAKPYQRAERAAAVRPDARAYTTTTKKYAATKKPTPTKATTAKPTTAKPTTVKYGEIFYNFNNFFVALCGKVE